MQSKITLEDKLENLLIRWTVFLVQVRAKRNAYSTPYWLAKRNSSLVH